MSLTTLLRIAREHNLFPTNSTIVIAVSGGTDSLALLHMLYSAQNQLHIKLHVATFDHGLRADSSDDSRFVRQIAANLGLPVTSAKADVTLLARQTGKSTELAARHARYHFLANVAREIGTNRIAVGHHADDQAETVLMHILRGTGLQGLQGMRIEAPVPGAPDIKLIRPLLTLHRDTLIAYCQQHKLRPRQDPSNTDVQYSRNHIRHKVLPFLKSVNPQVEDALIRLAEITSVDQDFLKSVYVRRVLPHIRREDERILLDREVFRNIHLALQRRFIHRSAIDLGYEDFGQTHILHAVQVGLRGNVGAVAQLPNGLQLRVDYESIVIENADAPVSEEGYLLLTHETIEVPVNVPGMTSIPGTNWSLLVVQGQDESASTIIRLSTEKRIVVRSRRPGDRFSPVGLHGKSQSVKKWMINRKIPRHLRNRIPLLVVDDEIIAIVVGEQWAISHKAVPRGEPTASTMSISIVS